MIHPISQVAIGRFIDLSALLEFIRSDKCPEGLVYDVDSADPYTNTWHVDDLIESYYANGGQRLPKEEIIKRYGSPTQKITSSA